MRIADMPFGKETQDRAHTVKRQALHKQMPAAGKENAGIHSMEKAGLYDEEEGATVAISGEGMGLAKKTKEEENLAMKEAMEWSVYQEMLEKSKEAAEKQGEGFGDLAKALEIARRILNGDIVPQQDEKFLMEFNSEIYMRVKSMAKMKEDPKEYDTLMEEEEEDNERPESGEDIHIREGAAKEEVQAQESGD